MQYILNQQEYDELLARKKTYVQGQKDVLQRLCTKIANEMPVKVRWRSGPDRPWGCILNKETLTNPHYCDECPVQTICPKEGKEYSQ